MSLEIRSAIPFFCAFSLIGAAPWAQPTLSLAATNTACQSGPTAESLPSTTDADGFVSLFDGQSLKGWWENCKTSHSQDDRNNGGFWIADPANKAIYSQQANNFAGSILTTNKKYGNYEIRFDFWPTFGNDAGIFNRTTEEGKCYQTVLDYIKNGSVGGAFGEASWKSGLNIDTYIFGSNSSTITEQGWSAITKNSTPANFGCPTAGCAASDWTKVWDVNGWNEIRVVFYGGLTAGGLVKMKTFIRRVEGAPGTSPDNWVPIYSDSQAVVTPASYIGLQIHRGSDRWLRTGKGTWYRNIRLRELDNEGKPLVVGVRPQSQIPTSQISMQFTGGNLSGHLGEASQIRVTDIQGKVYDEFRLGAGQMNRYVEAPKHGIIVVEVANSQGKQHLRFSRI